MRPDQRPDLRPDLPAEIRALIESLDGQHTTVAVHEHGQVQDYIHARLPDGSRWSFTVPVRDDGSIIGRHALRPPAQETPNEHSSQVRSRGAYSR